MKAMIGSAGSIFGIAVDARNQCFANSELSRKGAPVAIIFSVVALEAFINEMCEMAADYVIEKHETQPEKLKALSQLVAYVEDSHGPLLMKYDLAMLICSGHVFDKGSAPYQSFADLVTVRNALVHFKVWDKFEGNDAGEFVFPVQKPIARLQGKSILKSYPETVAVSWLERIATPAAANWACESAVAIVHPLVTALPDGVFKSVTQSIARSFVLPPVPDPMETK